MTQEAIKKPSLWQRFKNLSIIKKIGLSVGAFIILMFGIGAFAAIVDPDGFAEVQAEQEQAREDRAAEREAEAERKAQEQAEEEAEQARLQEEEAERERLEAEEAAEAERIAEEEEAARLAEEEAEAAAAAEIEAEEAAAEEEASQPEGIDAQIALLSNVRDFEDADIYYFDGDESLPTTSVNVSVEVGVGWSEASMCRSAREQTIRGLQFMRDEVTEDYDEVMFSYHARSEPNATGDTSILPMATAIYDYDTVQAIDDDAVTISNVWGAADGGGEALVCQRAG